MGKARRTIQEKMAYFIYKTRKYPIKCECGWGFNFRQTLDGHRFRYGHQKGNLIWAPLA